MNNFEKMNQLIKDYDENKNSFDIEELQSLRDNLSLTFFYLSDEISKTIANYDAKLNIKKIKRAEKEIEYRKSGLTIAESENQARVDCKKESFEETEALRMKERVRIITTAVPHILNSISTRINSVKQ